MRALLLRCECCRKDLRVEDIAARVSMTYTVKPFREVVHSRSEQAWCFSCWDSPDEKALNQYRAAGM